MNDLQETRKTPGIVIFVAVLNFITVSFSLVFMLFSLLALVFGNTMGLADYATRQISQYESQWNVSYGINFIFILLLVTSLLSFVFFLVIGVGLLRAKPYAWYLQLAMSILGLVGFPIWTILNGVILYYFFQPPVRGYFKV